MYFLVYFEAVFSLFSKVPVSSSSSQFYAFYFYFKTILTLFYAYFKAILSLLSKVFSSSSQLYPYFISILKLF